MYNVQVFIYFLLIYEICYFYLVTQARLQEMAANLEKLEELRNKSIKIIEDFERKLDDLERQETETLREVGVRILILKATVLNEIMKLLCLPGK